MYRQKCGLIDLNATLSLKYLLQWCSTRINPKKLGFLENLDTAPWDMKQDNPYLLAQPGFEPTPSLGLSIHIKKDLNAKATEPRRFHSF